MPLSCCSSGFRLGTQKTLFAEQMVSVKYVTLCSSPAFQGPELDPSVKETYLLLEHLNGERLGQ